MAHAPSILGAVPLLVLGVLGCGSDPTLVVPAFEVTVQSPLGVPERYRVIVSDGGTQAVAQTCPEQTGPDTIVCTPDGVRVAGRLRADSITVKARGFQWRTVQSGGGPLRDLEIELEPLNPFESNADYATGFGAEDGESAFVDMAVPVDTELGPSHSVKFLITDLGTEPQVFLQNTRRHPLHYDFARAVLGRPGSLSEFESATYHGAQRDTMAGTLTLYPDLSFESRAAEGRLRAPVTLNFFPSDDLSPNQMLVVHALLEERLEWVDLGGAEHRLVYVPAGQLQSDEIETATSDCRRREVLYGDPGEMYAGVEQQILNPGLAYGTLRLLDPEQLATEVVSWTDIVVLTRLPNELPIVAGSITAELQTPLAHVNLAARARGTPNLALRDADSDPRISAHLGQLVRFEVTRTGFTLEPATIEQAEAYWTSRVRQPVSLTYDVADHGLPTFEDVHFVDSSFCGVKAANLAELRRVLGERAPAGFVVPFFAYDQHMNTGGVTAALCAGARSDCEQEGRVGNLCEGAFERCSAAAEASATLYGYAEKLMGDDQVRSDTELREACLDGLVYAIRHVPVDPAFSAELDARVAELFGTAQVRLRSSTNAEDLPNFSGAGLYDSVSAEATGNDRASSEIRKVWASVWGFRAFEERQFWGIDARSVRMGVAVNASIDDEAANGVLITQNITNPGVAGMYVNVQLGEVSVTNPEDGALPEVFSIVPSPSGGVQVTRQRFSSLSPDTPLLDDAETNQLYAAAASVQQHFAPLYEQDVSELALDLEFKFHGPERALLVKQARPYASNPVSIQP